MSLDFLLKQAQTQSQIDILEGWGQGRATFGGLIGSLLLSRLLGELGELASDRVLRAATISFIGAVSKGRVEFTTEIFRHGKSVTQASARLIQNGEVAALLLASFGAPRSSEIEVASTSIAPEIKAPDEAMKFPCIAGLTPEFIRQIDMRLADGALPFSGANKPDFNGWMRWNEPFSTMTIAHLLGLIDAWPPSVLPMVKGPANASTLCWTVEFFDHAFEKSSQNWWQYKVVTDHADSGYAHAQAHIWDDEKRLVAISRQVSTVFA